MLRSLMLLSLFGCLASRHAGEVDALAELCCVSACVDGLNGGNICGITDCSDRAAPVCMSQDLASDDCTILYSNCDEGGDCSDGEVCRAAEGGGTYYTCRPPLDCDGPLFEAGCDYACRSDADCPAITPQCYLTGSAMGACAQVGFCGSG